MDTTPNNSVNPWAPGLLFYEDGDAYLALSGRPEKSVILRGKENWLSRFSNRPDTESRHVREEILALFARWLRMQNLCVLTGAGTSWYATNTLNAGLLATAKALLLGRRSDETLSAVMTFASDTAMPGKRIELFLSQLTGAVHHF
jgi:hypothetical protein